MCVASGVGCVGSIATSAVDGSPRHTYSNPWWSSHAYSTPSAAATHDTRPAAPVESKRPAAPSAARVSSSGSPKSRVENGSPGCSSDEKATAYHVLL